MLVHPDDADACAHVRMHPDDVSTCWCIPMDTCSYPLGPLWANPVYTVVHMYGIALQGFVNARASGRGPTGGGLHDPATASAVSYIARAHNARARPRATRARVHLGSPVLIPSVRCPSHRWLCLDSRIPPYKPCIRACTAGMGPYSPR